MAGEEGLFESLGALTRLLQPRPAAYNQVSRLARTAVQGCDHASVSMLGPEGQVTTAGASDDEPIRLDEAQYRADEGPCLSAIRGGTFIQVDEFANESRFPIFAADAVAAGIGSCLSVPILVGGRVEAGLNMYGTANHAYDAASVTAGQEAAEAVGLIIAGASAYERSLKLVEQMRVAMASRAEIEQAKGILMARSHCDADRAFDILRRASQRRNIKLREVAHTIVVNAAAGSTSMTPEDPGARAE